MHYNGNRNYALILFSHSFLPIMRILIVRVSSLGDVVHNLPVLTDIHRHYPEAIIDWVVEEPYVGLVKQNMYVNEVIPFALRRWRKNIFSPVTRKEFRTFLDRLKQNAYDYVFDTQGLIKTGIIMGFARTVENGRKIGLAHKTDGSGYEPLSRIFHDESISVEKHIHVVTRGREVVAKALGYTIDTVPDFGLVTPAPDPEWLPSRPYAVFFHGTSRDSKKWPHANWIEIGRILTENGLCILLPWGSPKEKEEAKRLADAIPDSRLLPRLSITDMVTLTGKASFIVGVDTGLSHLAAAFDKPTVQIYCNIPRWRTCADWSDNIISLGGENEVPSLDEVTLTVQRLLPKIG